MLSRKIFGNFLKEKKTQTDSKITLDAFFAYFSNMQQNISSVVNEESENFCSNYDFNTDEYMMLGTSY